MTSQYHQLPDTQMLDDDLVYSQEIVHDVWGVLYSINKRFKSLALTKTEYSAGRLPSCDIVFVNENKDISSLNREYTSQEKNVVPVNEKTLATFSKLHFKLIKDSSAVILEDHSSNGTHVNGECVGKGKKIILQHNDAVSLCTPAYKVYVYVDSTVYSTLSDLSSYPSDVKNNYVVSRTLGRGAYGEVRLMFHKRTFEKYAAKMVKKVTLNGHDHPKFNIMNEVEILKSLDHPCVIKIHNVIDSPDTLFMFLEFMEGGDLFDKVRTQKKLSEKVAKWFSYQMCKAVEYLHAQGIAHRDLKPENILLSSDSDKAIIKITDFGLSKFLNSQMVMKTLCGTSLYVAPEVIETNGQGAYTNQVDVWSMGVILYVCLTGQHPFNPQRQDLTLAQQICSGSYGFPRQRWKDVSTNAQSLVAKMMTVNSKIRLPVNRVTEHPWFQDRELQKNVRESKLFAEEEISRFFSKERDENLPPPKRARQNF